MLRAIYALAVLQAVLLLALLIAAPAGPDGMRQAITGAYTALATLISFAFVTPAILLARAGHVPSFALALAAAPLAIFAAWYVTAP